MPNYRKMKRHGNRKMYDTFEKSYVNSKDVLNFVESGDLVEIIDYRTKNDITEEQLFRCLACQNLENPHKITQNEYRAILKLGQGSLSGFVRFVLDNIDLSAHLSDIKFYSDDEIESIKSDAIAREKLEDQMRMKLFLTRESKKRSLTKEEEIALWELSIETKKADSFYILNLL